MAKTFRDLVDDAKTRGHLPGATHLSRGVLKVRADRALPDKGAPIVLYCGGGNRSALAADVLQVMGYADVRSMAGGWRAWTAAGHPTETP